MFGKLLKYELKANYKLFGLLSIIALAVGAVGGGVIRGMFLVGEHVEDDFALAMSMLSLFSAVCICLVLIAVYAAAVSYINYFRFYKHKFTDEGYLTFTLPVTAENIFWSSFINIVIWMLISSLVAAIAVMLTLGIGVGPFFVEQMYALLQENGWPEVTTQDWKELFKILGESFEIMVEEGMVQSGAPMYYGLTWLQTALSPIYSVMLTMSCITVGSVLVKRMKLLLSVGIYMGFTSVVALLTQISVYIPTFVAMYDAEHYFYWMSLPMVLQLALQLTVIIGGYFLTVRLMKRKLNLP